MAHLGNSLYNICFFNIKLYYFVSNSNFSYFIMANKLILAIINLYKKCCELLRLICIIVKPSKIKNILICKVEYGQYYKKSQNLILITAQRVEKMQNCITKFTKAPIEYINELRALKTGSITMKETTFYPAFPIALATSLLCLCGLSTYMIYYFFTVDESICFAHISYGIIVLAIIYPIESLIIYVCLFGSVALSQTKCWKVFTMIFFGLIVTGFSFGGLGFAFLCTIDVVHPLLIPATFLSSNTFIQVIVYCYLSFFCLYLILVPILTISYNERSKDPNPESTCSDTFCCVLYYICQFLFMVTALFMITIKLIGPPLLIYVLIEVSRAGMHNTVGSLTVFFVLTILSICLPMTIFCIIYLISNFICKPANKQQTNQQLQSEKTTVHEKQHSSQPAKPQQMTQTQVQKRRSVFLPADEKSFGEDINSNDIHNQML